MAIIFAESFRVLVNGVAKTQLSANNPLLGGAGTGFVTTDHVQIEIVFTEGDLQPNGASALGPSANLEYEPPPTSIEWWAELHRLDNRMIAWAASGQSQFSLGPIRFDLNLSAPPLFGCASGSEQMGPYLVLRFGSRFVPSNIVGPFAPGALGAQASGGPDILMMDATDALRQEYLSFGAAAAPAVADIVNLLPPFNVGNYHTPAVTMPGMTIPEWGIGIDGGLAARFASVLSAYRTSAVRQVDPATQQLVPFLVGGAQVTIPAAAALRVTSAYRNPSRNVFIGSLYPVTSRHVLGRALDIAPVTPVLGAVAGGGQIALDLHQHLYPTLVAAARTVAPGAITEHGATPVDVGSATEDHVHLQW